ncbi:MAG: hypothetical protein KA184_19010 [Candidatus Hydrogenedentes bacterium]|nr:hypothetical protein [Candidatus Hydrogenedentota bacterium]
MNDESTEEFFEQEDRAVEGAFDPQLPLPIPALRGPEPFATVIKRDGREEPFEKRKIAQAIFKAAQAIGGRDRDRAESLAAAVAIFLQKEQQGRPPTVDQVHDAVERVLVAMGHARTALTYARYRDRRARIRRLREGDLHHLIGELEEARHERESLAGRGGEALFVRTSADTLARWDRDRIVAALERETGLDRPQAILIALEVEAQIERAQMRTLTGALIRELVDARLVEHGLHEYRERHRRLGVPLYDAERILRGELDEAVVAETASAALSPPVTDRVLARAVKKEFALAEVFSAPVAEAHLRGELHLRHLGRVDRLCALAQPLAYVARYGVGPAGARDFAEPARHAETLLAHMVKYHELLQGYFADGVTWDAVNVFFAPFVQGRSDRDTAQFAQMLVYELAYLALTSGNGAQPPEITIHWTVPAQLRHEEAVGPGGAPAGKPYGAFEHAAQLLAWAIFDVLQRGGPGAVSLPGPVACVALDGAFFKSPGHAAFLLHAAHVAAERRGAHYLLVRDEPEDAAPYWHPHNVDLHDVVLNLPRAAYVAGSEAALFTELDRLARLAAHAHREKRRFLHALAGLYPAGPLELLTVVRDGAPYIRLDEGRCRIGVEGLNECVQFLLHEELHQGEEAAATAERILSHLRQRCSEEGAREGLHVLLTQNNDLEAGRRFAALDLKDFPRSAAATVKQDEATQELRYTPGARARRGHGLNPTEAARIEGRLHRYLDGGAVTEMPLPDTDPEPEAIADFLGKAYRQTENRRITFY